MSTKLKSERLGLRLPPAIKAQIQKAAEIQGLSVSNFVVAAAQAQASKVIDQQMVLKLCLEDSMALVGAFISEPEPNSKAIEAAKRYRSKMGKS
ncbi:MAG: DUF1778 domain-containing protein [Candidatus Obscuribacterales bacterium]|nr:DUF1778 domain-containing protein [Candidatus Obscuribacterales bacterium]